MSYMFYRCEGMERLNVAGFDTSAATDYASMFEGCAALRELDLSGWNTDGAENMSSMFKDCTSLTGIGCDPGEFGHGNTQSMYSNTAIKMENGEATTGQVASAGQVA